LILLVALYAPVYLPFLISFKVKSPKHLEFRWALRLASGGCFLLTLIPPPRLRHNFGDDVGGSVAGAAHNLPILFVWIWGGGLVCVGFFILIAFLARSNRRPASRQVSAEEAR